jgi:DNA-directed RNA polymerase sigma subunit (sigma70/sigma32)
MANTSRAPRGHTSSDADDDLRALRSRLEGVLRRLPDIERQVIEHRMGLVDGTPAKPGETAERLGLTIPEVKRIEERAFSRIREVVPIKNLQRFL